MLERHAARRIARGHGALALVGALLVATPGAATAAVRVAGVQVVGEVGLAVGECRQVGAGFDALAQQLCGHGCGALVAGMVVVDDQVHAAAAEVVDEL